MRHARVAGVFLLTMAAASIFLGLVQAQQIHRNGFETRQTCWIKGGADSAFREIVHDDADMVDPADHRARTLSHSAHPFLRSCCRGGPLPFRAGDPSSDRLTLRPAGRYNEARLAAGRFFCCLPEGART